MKHNFKISVNTGRSGVEKWFFYSGIHQYPVTKFLLKSFHEDSVFIDIGAHLGYYTLLLGQIAKKGQGKVVSFEANPNTFNELKANIELNGLTGIIDTFNVPLGDHEHQSELFIYTPGNTSLYRSEYKPRDILKVQVKTLDNFMNKLPNHVDLIKIDTEGNDLKVILGAKKIIQAYKPKIIFEFSYRSPKEDVINAFNFLNSLNYKLKYIYPNQQQFSFNKSPSPDQIYNKLIRLKRECDVICVPT